MESSIQEVPVWQRIVQNSLRTVVAASIPVYYTMVGGTTHADMPFETSIEELFEGNSRPLTDYLSPDDSVAHYLRVRGGLTQINKSFESHVGGTYGLEGILPINEVFGAHGAVRFNHFDGGNQYLMSLGAYKRSDYRGGFSEKLGAALIVDTFHDDRVNDLWLSQLRGQIGLATTENTAIGTSFTVNIDDQLTDLFFLPGDPQGTLTTVDTIGVYATRYIDDYLLQANVGYRESPNSVYVDLSVRKPLVPGKVFTYANTNYIEENGQWATWAGLEIRLGGHNDCGECTSTSRRREVWDDPVIFNSFNYGENSFWHNTNNPQIQSQSNGNDGPPQEGPPDIFPPDFLPDIFPADFFPADFLPPDIV